MGPVSAMKRPFVRIAIIGLATAVGLELGSRLVDRVRGKPWDAEAGRAAIEEVCRKLTRSWDVPGRNPDSDGDARPGDPMITQPYIGWEHPRTQVQITEDCAYFKKPEAAAAFDVYILGGSVAQTFGQIGERPLARRLRKDPRFEKRRIRVHDYALAAFKQPQLVMMLAYVLALGHEPDAVVVIDGFNEAALGWHNASLGTQPLYPHVPQWTKTVGAAPSDASLLEELVAVRKSQDRARNFGRKLLDSGLWRSCFLYHVGSVVLGNLRAGYVAKYASLEDGIHNGPKDPSIRGPEFETDESALEDTIVRAWFEGSMSIQGMCAQRGIPYLHVLQPTLLDKGSKPLTAKEIETGKADPSWSEGVRRLYPRFREQGRDFALRGIAFFDASGVFLDHKEDVYFDACHFAEHGNEILADAIGAELLRVLPK